MKAIKFLSMMLCLVMSMSFASCGDDDKDGPGSGGDKADIVGKWESYDDGYECFEFFSNGTYYEVNDEWSDSGEYECKGNLLILDGDEEDPYTILSLTKTRLVLRDSYDYVTTYTRVED